MDARVRFSPSYYPAVEAGLVRSGLLDAAEYVLCVIAIFLCSMVHFRFADLNFTISDGLFAFCAIAAIAAGGLSFQPFPRPAVLFWMGGLFLMVTGLSTSGMLSADPMRGMIVVAQYAFAFVVVPLVFFGRTFEQVVRLAKVYVYSAVAISLHGIYLIHVDGQRFTVFVTGSGRLAGLMERTNECATVLALSVPIVLLLATIGSMRKLLAWLLIGVIAYGVLLTGSNTGLLSLVYGLGVFAILGAPWRRLLVPLSIVAIMLPLFGGWIGDYLPDAFQKRVLTALETGDISQAGTFDGRVDLIYEAVAMTDRTALIGIGPDQYRVQSEMRAPVHNVYLLLWTEGGILSLIGFILILLGAIGCALTSLFDRINRAFAAAIFANVTMFMFAANALPHVYSRFWVVPIVLPMALACYGAIRDYGADEGFEARS